MSDIKSVFIDLTQGIDRALTSAGLAEDNGLETAVIISLFTDARAFPDDGLPPGADPRGVWSDSLTQTATPTGSRRWLLARAKQNNETLLKLVDYDRESLSWLLDSGLASAVNISAEWVANGVISEQISITLADGSALAVTLNSPIDTTIDPTAGE
ncbi:phage GP46 family protein [Endozoicomonas acroporae]|uniref:phage GP46 family protein n=1 Tax=Endozoicomonas acroporae TaxID=1701104 RepID=UPI0013D3C9B8|nr:phage GP46 family protein [Endozoicomonas acroporae]